MRTSLHRLCAALALLAGLGQAVAQQPAASASPAGEPAISYAECVQAMSLWVQDAPRMIRVSRMPIPEADQPVWADYFRLLFSDPYVMDRVCVMAAPPRLSSPWGPPMGPAPVPLDKAIPQVAKAGILRLDSRQQAELLRILWEGTAPGQPFDCMDSKRPRGRYTELAGKLGHEQFRRYMGLLAEGVKRESHATEPVPQALPGELEAGFRSAMRALSLRNPELVRRIGEGQEKGSTPELDCEAGRALMGLWNDLDEAALRALAYRLAQFGGT
ncbi:MAG: hypothetical protein EPO01_07500 [Aquabacterium sp.]|nr:MAG: hypothetical protein EPO01_07500 [Aquabacterium sp.]